MSPCPKCRASKFLCDEHFREQQAMSDAENVAAAPVTEKHRRQAAECVMPNGLEPFLVDRISQALATVEADALERGRREAFGEAVKDAVDRAENCSRLRVDANNPRADSVYGFATILLDGLAAHFRALAGEREGGE